MLLFLPTAPLVKLIRLVVASSLVMPTPPGNRRASASYCAATSLPAPLVPCVRLVVIASRLSSDQHPSTGASALSLALPRNGNGDGGGSGGADARARRQR
jgi:hypothetical protein